MKNLLLATLLLFLTGCWQSDPEPTFLGIEWGTPEKEWTNRMSTAGFQVYGSDVSDIRKFTGVLDGYPIYGFSLFGSSTGKRQLIKTIVYFDVNPNRDNIFDTYFAIVDKLSNKYGKPDASLHNWPSDFLSYRAQLIRFTRNDKYMLLDTWGRVATELDKTALMTVVTYESPLFVNKYSKQVKKKTGL